MCITVCLSTRNVPDLGASHARSSYIVGVLLYHCVLRDDFGHVWKHKQTNAIGCIK